MAQVEAVNIVTIISPLHTVNCPLFSAPPPICKIVLVG